MRRPLSGALLGIVFGLAVALILQQQGIWPLDRLTVFLLPGLAALLAILVTSLGREGSMGTLIVALVITIPMAVWGALGFTEVNERGQLNGGCEVNAASDIDSTVVTDTSRSDPFEIDPDGGLSWVATSPSVFDDYPWEIWTEIGGVKVTLDSEESEDNDGGSQINGDEVSNVTEYAEAQGISIDEIRGVVIVGGEAANTCDGFGFVSLVADPFETLASQIAAVIALLALIAILLLALLGRPDAAGGGDGGYASASDDAGSGAGPGIGAGLAAAGAGEEEHDAGDEFIDDLGNAADESGYGKDVEE